jgi:putative transposase
MPGKNTIKTYVENSYYHIYNRGVNKNLIFLDDQDYSVFISYLKTYLMPKDKQQLIASLLDKSIGYQERDKILKILKLKNFTDEVFLIAYSLMPNHLHFLLKQKLINSMEKFMSSLGTRYTMYFNKKYHRVGPLCQSIFKAVLVESEEQLLYLSSYIHRNSISISNDLFTQPSSLPEYLGLRKTEWIHPEIILDHFSKTDLKLSYESFVKQTEDVSLIMNHLIDID